MLSSHNTTRGKPRETHNCSSLWRANPSPWVATETQTTSATQPANASSLLSFISLFFEKLFHITFDIHKSPGSLDPQDLCLLFSLSTRGEDKPSSHWMRKNFWFHMGIYCLLSQWQLLQVNPKGLQTVSYIPNHKDLKFKLPFLTPALPWDSCTTVSLSIHHSSVQDFLFHLFKPSWSCFQLLWRSRQCQSDTCYSQRKSWSTSHLSDLGKVPHKINPTPTSHPLMHQYPSEHRFQYFCQWAAALFSSPPSLSEKASRTTKTLKKVLKKCIIRRRSQNNNLRIAAAKNTQSPHPFFRENIIRYHFPVVKTYLVFN